MNLKSLKEELSSMTDNIYFDSNECLREKSSNPSQLIQIIIKAETILEQMIEDKLDNKDEKYFLYGTLGNLYRIYGKPRIAIKYLKLNLDHSINERNYTREIISLIRLGEALKYDNKHEKALGKFNQALIKCNKPELNTYLDFVFQHKGKCLLELKRVEEAMKCFQEALELRKLKGSTNLINSTKEAIEFARCMQN
ncbi:tetratricopeptide repeat protein [Paenisporosarcina antarctica]|uniref:Tetratricopeptide repeat protein n=1 Tax=Paenisporosarcina antarctica TaxID=417367 RepID=A0A4P6ZX58_9BACL|nr:tetratricopeptide repeat protein [Paenisporosarcina antarctica]QBP41021.1 tetratricopeptide repeat protein [Paenisporosarcina antarctica]